MLDIPKSYSETDFFRRDGLSENGHINDDTDRESITSSSSSSAPLKRSNSALFHDLSKYLFLSDFDFGFDLDSVGDTTRKRFNDMKAKTKKRIQKFKQEAPLKGAELSKVQDKFIKRLTSFDERVQKNLRSSATEKLFYAEAVSLIATTGFLIGKYPEWFHVFHTVLLAVLMPIRFYTYFKRSFQYFLADLCYYVNLLLLAFIWWFPDSPSLFISVFSLSMGTLSFAVITWRNSLVLHSIEKTTSSFIHVMPPVTLFVIVHELPEDFRNERFPALSHFDHWNFINGIIWTSIYYTLWQVAYHYFITIRRKAKIESGTVTSFTYLKQRKKNSILGKFVTSLPYAWMQITAFTLIQFGYQLLTMIFCPIWFNYKHACGSFVLFIFIWASYNGATYYVDHFGKRFEKEVEKLKGEILELQHQNEKLQTMEEDAIADDDQDEDNNKLIDEKNNQDEQGEQGDKPMKLTVDNLKAANSMQPKDIKSS